MNNSKIFIAALLLLAVTFAASAFKGHKIPARPATNNGFALIELFTSEGCSSCPPADELVARIQKEDKDKPVYILAYHVDYWNNLGWKDQFSSAAYSQRQRRYAAWLKAEVYTPQIVVNGKREFVGSEEGTLRSAIKTGLQQADNSGLSFSDVHIEHDMLSVQYKTKGGNASPQPSPKERELALTIAFVQKAATSQVKHGENGGKTLQHINIVKALNTVALHQPAGNTTVHLPDGYNRQNWDIIGFTQNTNTGEVLSAQKITIPSV